MTLTKNKLILFCIIILAFFLRIYNINKIPNTLDVDEAAFGYNAYSILKTGKDEYGRFLPIYLQSFNDYKSPLLTYTIIPFIKIWGLNLWTIRLPSVLTGVGVIWLFYEITYQLFRQKKLSLLASLLAAISPWLIQYSRIAWDIELALFMVLLGIYFFLKSKSNQYFYYLSLFILALSTYAYHASRFFVVIFIPFLIFWQRKINRHLLFSLIIFVLILLPYLNLFITDKVSLRLYAISVFYNEQEQIDQAKTLANEKNNHIFAANFIHNRRLLPIDQFINGYLRILDPNLLFAPNFYNQIPSTRLFFIWQLPLLIIGFILIWKNKSVAWFLLIWLLIGLIPGGMTNLPVFDRRILLISFPLIIFISFGLLKIVKILKFNLLFSILVSISVFIYLHLYFIHGSNLVISSRTNNMQELVNLVNKESQNYQKIYVSLNIPENYIYYLYYLQYLPEKYLQEGGTISGGYLDEKIRFSKYHFKFITKKDLAHKNLYVIKGNENLPCLEILYTVKLLDNSPFTQIGKYNPNLLNCK